MAQLFGEVEGVVLLFCCLTTKQTKRGGLSKSRQSPENTLASFITQNEHDLLNQKLKYK